MMISQSSPTPHTFLPLFPTSFLKPLLSPPSSRRRLFGTSDIRNRCSAGGRLPESCCLCCWSRSNTQRAKMRQDRRVMSGGGLNRPKRRLQSQVIQFKFAPAQSHCLTERLLERLRRIGQSAGTLSLSLADPVDIPLKTTTNSEYSLSSCLSFTAFFEVRESVVGSERRVGNV